jgi:hypothetical protein
MRMTGAAALAEADARALRRPVDLDIPVANFWKTKRPAIPALDRSPRGESLGAKKRLPPTARNRSELGVGN